MVLQFNNLATSRMLSNYNFSLRNKLSGVVHRESYLFDPVEFTNLYIL